MIRTDREKVKMALHTNQAEPPQLGIVRQYGDINVYGNAMLGDGHMSIVQTSHDAEEQKRMSKTGSSTQTHWMLERLMILSSDQ